ncbi:hypothetical protein BaRGS_00037736 [Batillaria attramentaria]|uniref:Uncharacterized protein n=1 Tax=Batillaria attramentaria TaxID=370345 RepID=A0ABD0J7S3_9CAEN
MDAKGTAGVGKEGGSGGTNEDRPGHVDDLTVARAGDAGQDLDSDDVTDASDTSTTSTTTGTTTTTPDPIYQLYNGSLPKGESDHAVSFVRILFPVVSLSSIF